MGLQTAFKDLVIQRIERQFFSLLESMHDYFAANPTASASAAQTYLNGLAEPYPTDEVRIVDRVAAFNWLANKIHPYEGKATAYLSLRQFMLDNPKALLQVIDPDSGRGVVSKAELWARRMTGQAPTSGWAAGTVVNPTYSCTRDAARGNCLATETWTATIDGTQRSVTRTFSFSQDATGGWVSSPASWTVG